MITIILLALLASIIFTLGLLKRGGYLEAPFLFAAIYIGWVIPQLWSVLKNGEPYPGSINALTAMASLCFVGILIGWRIGTRQRFKNSNLLVRQLSEGQAFFATIGLSLIALPCALALRILIGEATEDGLPSGIYTIAHTFANLKFVSFTLSLIFFLRRKDTISLILVLSHLTIYVPVIFVDFRRRGILEFAFAILFALWVVYRFNVPRAALLGGLVAVSLFTFAVAELRNLSRELGRAPTLEEIANVNYLALSPLEDAEASPEIRNAAALVYRTQETQQFSFGAEIWDRFVFRFVPAQLIGADAKRSLFIGDGPERLLSEYGYVVPRGTTVTGIADSFYNFWYFGAVWFALIGFVLGRYWRRARSTPLSWDKAFYAAAIIPALHSIPMYSSYILDHYLFYFVFLKLFSVLSPVMIKKRRGNAAKESKFSRPDRTGVNIN